MKQKFTITYREPIYEQRPVTPPGTGFYSVCIGYSTMEVDVEVNAPMEQIAQKMGPKAARSKGKRSSDGMVTVMCKSTPKEINREMRLEEIHKILAKIDLGGGVDAEA